jgi:hypothetical protein
LSSILFSDVWRTLVQTRTSCGPEGRVNPLRPVALALATPGLADGQGRRREVRLAPRKQKEIIMSAKSTATIPENGTELFVPLNKLKKSPKNARKVPHSEASIEAYAASIAAKGILQNSSSSRRWMRMASRPDHRGGPAARPAAPGQAQGDQEERADPLHRRHHQRSARDQPGRKRHPGNMHPADQFEAFKKLADEAGNERGGHRRSVWRHGACGAAAAAACRHLPETNAGLPRWRP